MVRGMTLRPYGDPCSGWWASRSDCGFDSCTERLSQLKAAFFLSPPSSCAERHCALVATLSDAPDSALVASRCIAHPPMWKEYHWASSGAQCRGISSAAEHRTVNPLVIGASPIFPARNKKGPCVDHNKIHMVFYVVSFRYHPFRPVKTGFSLPHYGSIISS